MPTREFLEEVYKSTVRLSADDSEEAEDMIEENLTQLIMSDTDEKKTLCASSGLGLDEAYEEAKQLSGVSEYDQEPQDPDDDGIFIPEDFQTLKPTPVETEKLDYVLQAMVGRILAEF
ncbi:hypothetical protein NW762_008052 [Fusarium torreyae]|uniref:Uncharacterized protein n=1 Tax=Fusarium torreyae TaxID=1237075 RepID=A0A9W8RWY7_9HYPO|nr:hypothetical protein NW762_008052 [Fusarium torreyae]